jgi:hypothetical protein
MKPAKSLKKGCLSERGSNLSFLPGLPFWRSARDWPGGVDIPFLPEVSLHAVCPFAGRNAYNLATLGRYVQKIHASAVV